MNIYLLIGRALSPRAEGLLEPVRVARRDDGPAGRVVLRVTDREMALHGRDHHALLELDVRRAQPQHAGGLRRRKTPGVMENFVLSRFFAFFNQKQTSQRRRRSALSARSLSLLLE